VQRLFDGQGAYEAPPSYEVLTHDAVNSEQLSVHSWVMIHKVVYDLSAAEFDALVRDANAFLPGDQTIYTEFSAETPDWFSNNGFSCGGEKCYRNRRPQKAQGLTSFYISMDPKLIADIFKSRSL
jgi:hypothetical protein